LVESNLKTEPISNVNLADEVTRQIKKQILDGTLKPGQRLPAEKELSEMFSVGRTSIREALKALNAVGFISRSKQGTVVRDIKSQPLRELYYNLIGKQHSVEQLFEARMVFECNNAIFAAQRAMEEDINEMANCIHEMTTKDSEEYMKYEIAFHMAIAEAGRNKVLIEAYHVVRDLLAEAQKDLFYPDILEISRKHHKEIFNAIKNKNEKLAEQAMRKHIAYFAEVYKNRLV